MSDSVVSIAIPRPIDELFTYLIAEENLQKITVGGWVKVPFGRTSTYGFVVKKPEPISTLPESLPLSKLKKISFIAPSDQSLSEEVFRLLKWAHDYYRTPLGELFQIALPTSVLEKEPKRKKEKKSIPLIIGQELKLNDEQKNAVTGILSATQSVTLLEGITGSGKTEVYLELTKTILKTGKSVLILVPEIALSPQLLARFENSLGTEFGEIALWHSALSDGKKREDWLKMREGKIKIAIAARSGVFLPLENLGLIVVDEEHDSSFKQEERARYNAKDVAIVRGKLTNSKIVLGSATPSFESLLRVKEKRFHTVFLKNRYSGATLPEIKIIDLSKSVWVEGTQAPLAEETVQAIKDTLAKEEQVLVYLNRRGFSSFLFCEDCKSVWECPECSISLTFHQRKKKLVCHQCGHQENSPDFCKSCKSYKVIPVGSGTESLEIDLPRIIPEMTALRLDRDQITSQTRLENALEDFRQKKFNTLLGTQMLVKGHDFPDVTLVVVILADQLFRWPDFRSNERAYQVLSQVAGRSGRAVKPGRVLIQTYDPEHSVIQVLLGKKDLLDFQKEEFEMREALHYPPYSRTARIRFESKDAADAKKLSQNAAEFIESIGKEVELLGPTESFIEKLKGTYRFEVLLKSKRVDSLSHVLAHFQAQFKPERSQWIIDVDPVGL